MPWRTLALSFCTIILSGISTGIYAQNTDQTEHLAQPAPVQAANQATDNKDTDSNSKSAHPSTSTQTTSIQKPEFKTCSIRGSSGNGNLTAECARWMQPIDRSNAQGEQIELAITRIKTTALEPAADAFTIINGGPGGSSIDMLVDFGTIIQAFTRERDVIVIDQRGTGRSAPLKCSALTDSAEDISQEATLSLTQKCLDTLPHDPRFFTTSAAVDDLEALRVALGYDQLSIYGVSYGTRVAMQFMRTYPNSTRRVVIDGVVPPDHVLGLDVAKHSHDSLQSVLERCAADEHCNKAFPELDIELAQLSERLKAEEIPLQLQHPVTGQTTNIDLSYGHLAVWIRFALYAPETSALIPLAIHQASVEKNYLPIAANALRLIHDLNASLTYGMHNAVVCTEDAPYFTAQEEDLLELDETYLGRDMYETLATMCSIWPQGYKYSDIKEPLISDIPTLVLSGEFDPITPPKWGQIVMPGLSQAKHIIAPGQGHGVISRGCFPKLILDFVETDAITDTPDQQSANATSYFDELDLSCIEHLAAYPFFIDLMGPAP